MDFRFRCAATATRERAIQFSSAASAARARLRLSAEFPLARIQFHPTLYLYIYKKPPTFRLDRASSSTAPRGISPRVYIYYIYTYTQYKGENDRRDAAHGSAFLYKQSGGVEWPRAQGPVEVVGAYWVRGGTCARADRRRESANSV